MSVHKRIRDGRIRLGLTEQQFADRIGVTRGSVQQWEKEGGTAPNRTRQPEVANLLGLTVAELMSQANDAQLSNPGQPSSPPMSPALGIEAIAQALVQMTDAQREAMAGKLASLARAPDSPTLKKSISDLLSTPAPAASAPRPATAAQVAPEHQEQINQLTQAAEARRDDQNRKQRNSIPRDGTTGH